MSKNFGILYRISKMFASTEEAENPEITRLIDVKNLNTLGLGEGPLCCSFDRKMKIFTVGYKNGTMKLFNKMGHHISHSHCSLQPIIATEFLENLGLIAYASSDNTVSLVDFRMDEFVSIGQHKLKYESFTCLKVCQKTKWIYVGTNRGAVYTLMREDISHVSNKICYNQVDDDTHYSVVGVDVCPKDCSMVLIGYSNGLVVLWSLKRRGPKHKIRISSGLLDLRFGGGKNCAVCVDYLGVAKTDFAKTTRNETRKIRGKLISADRTVVLGEGEFLHLLGKDSVLLESPFVGGVPVDDTNFVVLCQNDVCLLNVGEEVSRTPFWDLTRFKDPCCLAYLGDRGVLVSGHSDGSLKLWDLTDGVTLRQTINWGKLFMDCGGSADPSVTQLLTRGSSLLAVTSFTVVLFRQLPYEESSSAPVVELSEEGLDIMYIGDLPTTQEEGHHPALSIISKSGGILSANYNDKMVVVITSEGDLHIVSLERCKLVCRIAMGECASSLRFFRDSHFIAVFRRNLVSVRMEDDWGCTQSALSYSGDKITEFTISQCDRGEVITALTDTGVATFSLAEEGDRLQLDRIAQREVLDAIKVTPILRPHLLLACELDGGIVVFYSLPDLLPSRRFDFLEICGDGVKLWTDHGIGFSHKDDGTVHQFSFMRDLPIKKKSFHNPVAEPDLKKSRSFISRIRGSEVNDKILASPVQSGMSALNQTADNLNLRGEKLNQLTERAEHMSNQAKVFADMSKQLCDKYEKKSKFLFF